MTGTSVPSISEESALRFSQLKAAAKKAHGLSLLPVLNRRTGEYDVCICLRRSGKVNGETVEFIAPIAALIEGNPQERYDIEATLKELGVVNTLYRVKWEIDIDAGSFRDAARKARKIQLDGDSTATVFEVKRGPHNVTVDLLDMREAIGEWAVQYGETARMTGWLLRYYDGDLHITDRDSQARDSEWESHVLHAPHVRSAPDREAADAAVALLIEHSPDYWDDIVSQGVTNMNHQANTRFRHTTQLYVQECCKCHMLFALPSDLESRLRANGETFYCPAGHGQHYNSGASKEQRLQAKLDAAIRSATWHEERALAAKRREIAAKAQATKARNALAKHKVRVGNGVCPCCTRSFANLQRHMATKHPEYKG